MRVPVKRFVLLGFAALLTLSVTGCDTQPGFEEDVEKRCPGEVNALSTPSDLVLYAGEETATMRIGSDTLFTHTIEQQLDYSAKSSASDIVGVEISGSDTLVVDILPLQAGEAQVDIKATDVCGQSQTVSFKVEVADICTLAAEQEYDVYFPINVGNVWSYDYRRNSQSRSHPNYLTEGTLTWELTSATACQNGRQTFSIQETVEGIVTLPADNPDYEEEVLQTKTLAGEIRGRRLLIEEYTDSEYLDVFWIQPPSTPDIVFIRVDTTWYDVTRHFQDWEIVLKREAGITQWHTSFSDKYGGRAVDLVSDESQ